MRKARLALLAALVATIAVVVGAFYASQRRNLAQAPAPPAPLPAEVGSTAANWSWSHSSKDRAVVQVRARDFRQIRDASRFELDEVELKIYSRSGDTYDLVRSRQAQFDQSAERLFSEGAVTIVLGLPARGAPPPGKRYVEIRTSSLAYDNKTGVASTDQPAVFQFEDGEGRSTGAVYDTARRYLWMKNDAEIFAPPMRIRAGELHYFEAEQRIELRPWSSIERGEQGMRAAASTVFLDGGLLRRIEAAQGEGWDRSSAREVRFSGDRLEAWFASGRTLERAAGIGNVEFSSRSAAGVTRVTGGRMELEFVAPAAAAEAQLATAMVHERARVENIPAAGGAQPAETRILTGESVLLTMRPGGQEVQSVETLSAGRLEIAPQQPSQWRRTLAAQRMSVQYLPGNRLETLRAFGAIEVRSDPPAAGAPPRLSWSEDLQAVFDPETGQMRELRQWNKFRYQEGGRQARSSGARFDVAADRMYLDAEARVWDETTETAADSMVLDQRQDKFQAEGRVRSSHRPPPEKPGADRANEALFASDRPIHATAARLDSERGGRLLHYRGAARLWQDGNSIQAEQIDLDRAARTLAARGGVVSVLAEQDAGSRLMIVSSDSLSYTDQESMAFYRGQVQMRRSNLTVRSAELEAFLKPRSQVRSGESRLERASARGQVEILESAGERRNPASLRRARAEQAEYLTAEGKVVLRGGEPVIEQPDRGSTRGTELTYYLNQERLLVSGAPQAPSESRQRTQRRP